MVQKLLPLSWNKSWGNTALLGALHKAVHPNWKHGCATPLGMRKHPAALLVNGSPAREPASWYERCSAATGFLRDQLVNGKCDPERATSESVSLLTHLWYLPCKYTLQLHLLPDAPPEISVIQKIITWDRTQWRVISVPPHLCVNKHRAASGTVYLMIALSFLYVFTNKTARNENSEGIRNSSRKTDDLFCFWGSPRPPETKNTQADTRTHSRDWSQIKCFFLKNVTSIINICVWGNYCNGLTNALEKSEC